MTLRCSACSPEMQENSKYAIGVDIGGQTAKIGLVRSDGFIAGRRVIRTDTYGKEAPAFIRDLAFEIKDLLLSCGEPVLQGAGVGAPNGNYFTGCIENAPNIQWASDTSVPIALFLSEALGGLKVTLTNDANAAAMGEMEYGAARGMKDFIVITLGTGLGSGIVCNGHLVYGHDGLAGELGHVCVKEGGRKCGCGKKGCLETYASATGVALTAEEMLKKSDEPSLLRGLQNITSKDVCEAAQKGDELAQRVFEYTGTILGKELANFVAFSSPEAIILFGGLTKAGELLRAPVVKAMEDNLMPIWKGKIKVLFSPLSGSDAAILGASALAWNND